MNSPGLYTFRQGGRLYRIRKAPMETDDAAAKRGRKIAKDLCQPDPPSVPAAVSGSFMTES
jgi:hypothetical protein